MSIVDSVFSTRYISAIGVTALVYDHLLTGEREVELIWGNPPAGAINRLGFLFNRYLTETMAIYVAYMLSGGSKGLGAQVCRVFIWVHSIAATTFIVLSHYIIMTRVYTLWSGNRPSIKRLLTGTFTVAISVAMVFTIVTACQVQAGLEYNIEIHMCVFSKKPPALIVMLSAMTALDLFIIAMIITNALEIPRENQAQVLVVLQRDGAKMFACLFVLRLVSLIIATVGSPAYCFVTLTVVWMMCSIVTSRIQLRVEQLRHQESLGTARAGDMELRSFFQG
ncbi:hypothetical protein B0H14DRAFT_3164566 [Mycena olivaceomarginata]|nr:hypothetical protein B0H14DRAFT_3164566 [Mycena olivaceomarginata]